MDNKNSVMCSLMLVIFVLLIVDICKKKKDEGMEGFTGDDIEDIEDESGQKRNLIASIVFLFICVIFLGCFCSFVLTDTTSGTFKQNLDESTAIKTLFFLSFGIVFCITLISFTKLDNKENLNYNRDQHIGISFGVTFAVLIIMFFIIAYYLSHHPSKMLEMLFYFDWVKNLFFNKTDGL